jgi:hypothetical protein
VINKIIVLNSIVYNMNKKEIFEMDVIMIEIADTKEKVKKTMKYWQSVLDELDRRAMEYSQLSFSIVVIVEVCMVLYVVAYSRVVNIA